MGRSLLDHTGPYDIEFSDLRFTVAGKDGNKVEILQGVNGYCVSGRLFSIMGASGAGKTTLLDILAYNIYGKGRISGEVLVGGKPRQRSSFMHLSCYVMQRDILMASATVRETLLTSALLRLPTDMDRSDKEMQVEKILEEMDLMRCADTLVGDELDGIKGVSGGQRRRVSVGMELVTDPHIIFLDEPTSGLDSENALGLMKMLIQLARRQRTVVCTIHQPNSDITDQFDDFLLLAGGRTVYFGQYSSSMDYFDCAGYPCPTFKNPTDHYLSLTSKPDIAHVLANYHDRRERKILQGLSDVSDLEEGIGSALSPAGKPQKKDSDLLGLDGLQPAVPFFCQAQILTVRFFRCFYRNPVQLMSEIVQYIFLGLFTGLMYLQLDRSAGNGMYNRAASFWFILAISCFTPSFTTVTVWDRERLLLRRETQAKMYSVPSYFLAKTLVIVPFEVIQTSLFATIIYFMIHYQYNIKKFLIFAAILNIFQLISENIGCMCAVIGGNAVYGVIVLTFVLLLLLAFSGFLVAVTPVYFRWLGQMSYLTFAFAAMLQNELSGLTLFDPDGNAIDAMELFPPAVRRLNNFSLSGNIAMLGGLYVVTRFLALFFLMGAARLRAL